MSAGRLGRHELFMQAAALFAQRSTCLRGQVGCVIVRDRRIIASGYNGAPPGLPHCLDEGCDLERDPPLGCQRTVHDIANAIAFAARHGVSTDGCTIYATHSPCTKCAQLALSAGIVEFHYDKPYRLGDPELLEAAGVKVVGYGA